MNREDLNRLVKELLHELSDPERHLATIANDFRECGIDYAVIGSLAVRIHNYPRRGDDIDVLISRDGYPKIEKYLIGNGYSYRSGANRHLYYEFLGGRIPLDIYVEGEERDGFPLPDPRASRIKVCGIWYASLPLLIALKIRAQDYGDLFKLVQENELKAEFAAGLEPDVKDKFLDMLRELEIKG